MTFRSSPDTHSEAGCGDMATTPTVQLRHDEPGDGWHIDWMLASAAADALVTVRLPGRLDRLEPGSRMRGTWLGDHRRRYLTYEGPLTGRRGSVRRVAEGRIIDWASDGDEWWITVVWTGGPRQLLRIPAAHPGGRPGEACEIYCESEHGSPSVSR